MAGYSVECAIKACIAKHTKKFEFPNKDLANRAWNHDLEQLIGIAGIRKELNDEMETNKTLELTGLW